MATSNIGKGAIISYVAIFLNIAISFLYTPWMLGQVGASDYGLYSLIISFISYFIIDFGLTSAIARFVAKYRAEGNNKKVENILGLTLNIFFLIDAIIFLCLIVCYFFLTDIFTGLTSEELAKLKVLYVIAGTFSVLTFCLKPLDGALTAYEYYVPAKLIDMVYKVGSVGLVVVALYLGGNIYHLVLINGGLSFLTSVYRYFYWHKKTGLTPNLKFCDKMEAKAIFSFSGWTFLVGLAMRFRLNLVPSILGIFSNSYQITVFSLGLTIEAMLYTLTSALNGLFLPKVSRLVYSDDNQSIMELMIRVGRIQLFLITCIITGFLVCGRTFIRLWVGDEFSDVYYITLALILPFMIAVTLQIAMDKIFALGKVKYTAKAVFVTSIIGLVASCCVASEYGAVGCGLCSAVASLFTQLWYLHIFKRKIHIDILTFFKECHAKILPLLSILSMSFYLLYSYLNIQDWFGMLVAAGIYIVCFVGLSWSCIMNQYEKELVKTLLRIK